MDETIILIHPGKQDIKKKIFAELKSTSREENFSAGQEGYRRVRKFKVWAHEYDDEPILEYGKERLTIYRTYKLNSEYIELYAGERIGNGRR